MPVQIISLKKKGRYFLLGITGSEKPVRFHPDIIAEYTIYEGKELQESEYETVLDRNLFRLAWESAMRMLSRRAHCEQDLRRKQIAKGVKSGTADNVLSECRRLNLIDDAKFAVDYIRELIEAGNGRQLIKIKLSRKGVPGEILEESLEKSFSDSDESRAAETAFRKKLPSLKHEKNVRKKKEKLYRYMISKGFGYDVISSFLEKLD